MRSQDVQLWCDARLKRVVFNSLFYAIYLDEEVTLLLSDPKFKRAL